MNKVLFILFSLIWITTLVMMILLKNKVLVFDLEQGLKIYIEERKKEDADEL